MQPFDKTNPPTGPVPYHLGSASVSWLGQVIDSECECRRVHQVEVAQIMGYVLSARHQSR